jgi:Arm domain-containing DNA-binding protein
MSGQTITKTLVDGLEPAASEYTIWDAKLPGFGVRVRPSGAKSFVIVYRAGTGRTAPVRRLTLAAVGKIAPEAARTQAKILLGTVANGADPAAEKRAKRPKAEQLTFDELAQRYIDEYAKPNKSSWENDVGYLKRPRTALKRVLASSVTDDDIADVLDEIAEDAPVSANRAQSVIHKMFEWARQPGRKHVPSNPIHGMERRGGSDISPSYRDNPGRLCRRRLPAPGGCTSETAQELETFACSPQYWGNRTATCGGEQARRCTGIPERMDNTHPAIKGG